MGPVYPLRRPVSIFCAILNVALVLYTSLPLTHEYIEAYKFPSSHPPYALRKHLVAPTHEFVTLSRILADLKIPSPFAYISKSSIHVYHPSLATSMGSYSAGEPPHRDPAQLPPLSFTDRPVTAAEGGHIQQLQKLMEGGNLQTAASFYQQWKDTEPKLVDLFATLLEPKAAIVPGQRTVMTLPERERQRVFASFKNNNAAIIFIGWVEPLQHDDSPEAANLVGFAGAAMVTDVKMLDKTGELGVEIIGRCRVLEVVNVDAQQCQVKVLPHRDNMENSKSTSQTKTNIRALHTLYDRCNQEEAVYRELQGNHDIAAVVRMRPLLHEKVDEMLSRLEDPTENEILEYTSFCAMDYHIDHRARCWSVELQDTEIRLGLVRSALEEKLKKLKLEVQSLKARVQ